MSRIKTISWMLLVIIVIGIVAIFTRTPVRSAGESAESASAVADTPVSSDTTPEDSVDTDGGREPQNSSQ